MAPFTPSAVADGTLYAARPGAGCTLTKRKLFFRFPSSFERLLYSVPQKYYRCLNDHQSISVGRVVAQLGAALAIVRTRFQVLGSNFLPRLTEPSIPSTELGLAWEGRNSDLFVA